MIKFHIGVNYSTNKIKIKYIIGILILISENDVVSFKINQKTHMINVHQNQHDILKTEVRNNTRNRLKTNICFYLIYIWKVVENECNCLGYHQLMFACVCVFISHC